MTARTPFSLTVYNGLVALNAVSNVAYRLQQYTEQDTNVIVLADAGGLAHDDDVPNLHRQHRFQIACYHATPATARAWAQAIYEAFLTTYANTRAPWVLTGWTIPQLRVDPPRDLGIIPADPTRRYKVVIDLLCICPVMT